MRAIAYIEDGHAQMEQSLQYAFETLAQDAKGMPLKDVHARFNDLWSRHKDSPAPDFNRLGFKTVKTYDREAHIGLPLRRLSFAERAGDAFMPVVEAALLAGAAYFFGQWGARDVSKILMDTSSFTTLDMLGMIGDVGMSAVCAGASLALVKKAFNRVSENTLGVLIPKNAAHDLRAATIGRFVNPAP